MYNIIQYFLLVPILFLLSFSNIALETKLNNKTLEIWTKAREIDTLRKVSKELSTKDEMLKIDNLVDVETYKSLPNKIKDYLRLNYKFYFIPSAELLLSEYETSQNEHPFFIVGDFNSDNYDDYVFILESCYLANYGDWGTEQRIVVIYSINASEYNHFERHLSSGVGIYHFVDAKLNKIKANVEYNFIGKVKVKRPKDSILLMVENKDVGEIIKWNNGNFSIETIWCEL